MRRSVVVKTAAVTMKLKNWGRGLSRVAALCLFPLTSAGRGAAQATAQAGRRNTKMNHFRFSFSSTLVHSHLFSRLGRFTLSMLLLLICTHVPVFGQQQATKSADHEGANHRRSMHAVKVPFKPGPFGPDGKVHQVTPTTVESFPNEAETPQVEEASALARSGIFTLTNKRPSSSLSSQQLSLLHWNPSKLNVAENPLLGLELLKQPIEPATKADKRILRSSVPQHGTEFPGIGATGFAPPDGGVAAGPLQVLEVVNSSINVYDKNGNLLSSQTLSNFFSALGTPGSDFIYDPSIYYDFYTARFWVLAVSENDNPNRSSILVAVSAANDVTQGWLEYWTDATLDGPNSTSNWCDYPHLGMDADAVYISCNQISFPRTGNNPGSFQYAKVRISTWDEFINDNCCVAWDIWNLKEGSNNSSTSYTVRPTLERFVGHGFGDFWVDAEGSGGSGNTFKVWQLSNPTACCDGSGGPTLASVEQPVGSYGVAPAAAQPLDVFGQTVQAIDTGNTSIKFATYQFGHLSVGQTIACTQGGTTTDSCAAFTEMDVSGYPTINNINDWYLSQPAGEDVYYPFVDQNLNSDKTMVYSRSDGSSVYVGAYYITIPNSTTCTYCAGGETTMKAGAATYLQDDTNNPPRNRWGDYHGAGTDPDLLGIWVEGEYASAINTWSTDVEPSYNSYFPIDSPSPTSVNYGNQPVYSVGTTQYVTFTNTGNATLITNSTYIFGSTYFFIVFDGCSFVTLQPGNNCSEGIDFLPTSTGVANAYMVVNDNSPTGAGQAPLSGTGIQAGTSTSLSSSLNPSTFGQSVTFTAQVVSLTAGTPTGTVTFDDGASVLGTVALNSSGVAQITAANLSGGTHAITVFYSGDTLYLGSSNGLLQVVNPAPTSTSVGSSLNPSTYGTSVTFTASVSSGLGTPNGKVTFMDGATAIGAGTLSGGKASLATSALSGGTHSIAAIYGGSSNFAASTSSALTQFVNRAASATALTSSANPSSYKQAVTFTAKVTSSAGIPAGTIAFKNGAATMGMATLNGSGVASFSTSTLPVGAYSITAVYLGSANFKTSASPAISQSVDKAKTTTAVTSSVNPSSYHQFVKLTATVVGAFGGEPLGPVTFKSGATILGTGNLTSSGVAVLYVDTLAVGAHSITADYAGNGNYVASTSAALTQIVRKATTKNFLTSSLNPSTHGAAVTFTASIVVPYGGTVTGKVTFKNGTATLGTGTVSSSNKATFTTSTLAVGTHSITAVYPGDANFTASTSQVLKQVVK
jgi:hypothetical protein